MASMYYCTVYTNPSVKATHKKSLFPVQRVAKIMATRAAANPFFFLYFLFGKKKTENFAKKKKRVPLGTYLVSRPLDRKHTFF